MESRCQEKCIQQLTRVCITVERFLGWVSFIIYIYCDFRVFALHAEFQLPILKTMTPPTSSLASFVPTLTTSSPLYNYQVPSTRVAHFIPLLATTHLPGAFQHSKDPPPAHTVDTSTNRYVPRSPLQGLVRARTQVPTYRKPFRRA